MRLSGRLQDRGRGESRVLRPKTLRRKPGKGPRKGSSTGHFNSTRGVNASARPECESNLNSDARAIRARVQALSGDQLLELYHELVDKRFEGVIRYTEVFELELISARLDAEGQLDVVALAALN